MTEKSKLPLKTYTGETVYFSGYVSAHLYVYHYNGCRCYVWSRMHEMAFNGFKEIINQLQ